MESKLTSFIYQTLVHPTPNEEFSLDFFYYSNDLKCDSIPCKKTSCFEELLALIDELEEVHQ